MYVFGSEKTIAFLSERVKNILPVRVGDAGGRNNFRFDACENSYRCVERGKEGKERASENPKYTRKETQKKIPTRNIAPRYRNVRRVATTP